MELYGICSKYILNCLQLLLQKHPQPHCEQLLHKFFLLLFVYKHQNNLFPDIFHDYFVRNTHSTRQSNKVKGQSEGSCGINYQLTLNYPYH